MFRHIVVWKLAGPTAGEMDEQAAGITERMKALVGVVPSIRALEISRNALFPDENSDLVVLIDFDDLEGFLAYRSHPAHVAVSQYLKPRYATRMAIDFTR